MVDLPAPQERQGPAAGPRRDDRGAPRRTSVDAAEAAIRDAIVALPAANWREIQGRASSIGVTAELLSDGSELRLVADIPVLGPTAGE